MSGTEIIAIDLDKCYGCSHCAQKAPGIYEVIEEGIRRLICRHCENPPCVAACPVDSLEKKEGEDLKRHTFLCVSCKQCANACPVGANPMEILTYKTYPVYGTDINKCLKICKKGAIELKEKVSDDYEIIKEKFAFRADGWKK